MVLPNVLIILEVKNISGKLEFKADYKQVVRWINDDEEGFASFHLQVERQKRQLEKWLQNNKFPSIPVDYFIVMANPRTIVTSIPANHRILEKVIPIAEIPLSINSTTTKFTRTKLKKNELSKLTEILANDHTESTNNLLANFKISGEDLKKGVACPNCLSIPMKRKTGIWHCNDCQHQSRDAHHKAIKELVCLMGDGVSNQMVRDFLLIKSPVTTKRLLRSMKLTIKGVNKGSRYYLFE